MERLSALEAVALRAAELVLQYRVDPLDGETLELVGALEEAIDDLNATDGPEPPAPDAFLEDDYEARTDIGDDA